jgi:RimJ/RimL family protein N-acetyltransferase
MKYVMETERLKLICCDEPLIRAVLDSDAAITAMLNVEVAPQWNHGGAPAFQFSLKQITEHPDNEKWMTYVVVLKSENRLIGGGGYKGRPTAEGMVEIGYGIAEIYRNRGFATEMAMALTENAFKDSTVKMVMAHTLAAENASVKVLKRCGMKYAGEGFDPEDGKLWRWEIRREDLK